MKLLDFISLEFDHSDIQDESDLGRLISGDEGTQREVPTIEVPVTIEAGEISRIYPSVYNVEWTDVFLKDGDILTAQMARDLFKIKWLEARGEIMAKKAFKDFSYLDEGLKIRVHQN